MKRLLLCIFFALFCTIRLSAQWIQSSLGDAQIGCNIFSDGSGVWAATLCFDRANRYHRTLVALSGTHGRCLPLESTTS